LVCAYTFIRPRQYPPSGRRSASALRPTLRLVIEVETIPWHSHLLSVLAAVKVKRRKRSGRRSRIIWPHRTAARTQKPLQNYIRHSSTAQAIEWECIGQGLRRVARREAFPATAVERGAIWSSTVAGRSPRKSAVSPTLISSIFGASRTRREKAPVSRLFALLAAENPSRVGQFKRNLSLRPSGSRSSAIADEIADKNAPRYGGPRLGGSWWLQSSVGGRRRFAFSASPRTHPRPGRRFRSALLPSEVQAGGPFRGGALPKNSRQSDASIALLLLPVVHGGHKPSSRRPD